MRVIAVLHVADIDAAKTFYTDYLGLSAEEFNMGWVARDTSPDTGESPARYPPPTQSRYPSA
jgi:catechol 2,3-dioxygenase-like lactoylglutathione lyase family enzyme